MAAVAHGTHVGVCCHGDMWSDRVCNGRNCHQAKGNKGHGNRDPVSQNMWHGRPYVATSNIATVRLWSIGL